MDCTEAGEHLHDLNRERLDADIAEAVRLHVSQCVSCASLLQEEAQLRAMIQAQAPRYVAPPPLKARIETLLARSASPQQAVTQAAIADTDGNGAGSHKTAATTIIGRSRWRDMFRAHPWAIGSLAGALGVLVVVWGSWLWLARDPVSLLAERAVAEHREYVKETMDSPAADPLAVIGKVQSKVAFAFGPVFPGDSQIQLISGKTETLRGKRAAMFIYRDGSGRYTTLFLMPEAGIVVPDEGRMPIESFKPYHRVISSRRLLLWKQGNLACVLVSDLDQGGLVSVFLKIRKMA